MSNNTKIYVTFPTDTESIDYSITTVSPNKYMNNNSSLSSRMKSISSMDSNEYDTFVNNCLQCFENTPLKKYKYTWNNPNFEYNHLRFHK
jgi:hypothetical protein